MFLRESQAGQKLSKREIEVFLLITEGHSGAEAAEKLEISKRTVDFHLQNVYKKLQVANRVQAFRKMSKMGLIPL
jgi:DNA-binding NarL/FixJ family response regulator